MRVVYLGQIPAHFGVIVFIGTFLFVQTTKALEVEFIGADKLKVLEKRKEIRKLKIMTLTNLASNWFLKIIIKLQILLHYFTCFYFSFLFLFYQSYVHIFRL